MYGAVLGDIIGSPFENVSPAPEKNFLLFSRGCHFTDDTVLTLAVADALMKSDPEADTKTIAENVRESLLSWSGRFAWQFTGPYKEWMDDPEHSPYGSFGSGAAMRVSCIGYMYDTWDRTAEVCEAVTGITHDHPEAYRGALGAAAAIFLAKKGDDKEMIRQEIAEAYGYDLYTSMDELRKNYVPDRTCEHTVPAALSCFFASGSFEEAVRNAVSLGGDTGTLACIAGSAAESYYGVPDDLKKECMLRIPGELRDVLRRFEKDWMPKQEDQSFADRRKFIDWTDWDRQDMRTDVDREEYLRLLKEGMDAGWREALVVTAYGSYGGNSLMETDWYKARDCLLKLIENEAELDAFWYNTLGYICYYGRCNNGVPEYDQAFKYFSVAAWAGVFEAQYKLADMFQTGRGTLKNYEAAGCLIRDVYSKNLDLIRRENFDCKFADAALRMGSIFERGLGVDRDSRAAMTFYLQARFAIRERRRIRDCFGDAKVEKNIEDAIRDLKSEAPPDFFKTKLEENFPFLLLQLITDSYGMEVACFEKDGEAFIIGRAVSGPDGPGKQLFTVPELEVCDLSDSVVMRIEGLQDMAFSGREDHYYVNEIVRNDEEGSWEFCYRGKPMLTLVCSGFSFEK